MVATEKGQDCCRFEDQGKRAAREKMECHYLKLVMVVGLLTLIMYISVLYEAFSLVELGQHQEGNEI